MRVPVAKKEKLTSQKNLAVWTWGQSLTVTGQKELSVSHSGGVSLDAHPSMRKPFFSGISGKL